ncbi:hypothetical protein [Aquamicrobium soli]|uniref:Uncharacterized protein n=1 Tax=Aquamicrobium soli TaxID=1811518 RepID=A0ABV7K956_9HYPH
MALFQFGGTRFVGVLGDFAKRLTRLRHKRLALVVKLFQAHVYTSWEMAARRNCGRNGIGDQMAAGPPSG